MEKTTLFFVLLFPSLYFALDTGLRVRNDPNISDVLHLLKLQETQFNTKLASLEEHIKEQSSTIARHETTIRNQALQMKELAPCLEVLKENGSWMTEGKSGSKRFLEQHATGSPNGSWMAEGNSGSKRFLEQHATGSPNGSWMAEGKSGSKRFLEQHATGSPVQANTKVAFSAYLSQDLDGIDGNETIVFDSLVLNEGASYNDTSGVFTTQVPGVYLFSFVVNTYKDTPLKVNLVVNGELKSNDMIRPHFEPTANVQGSNVVLLRLTTGDDVWVETDGSASELTFGTSVYGRDTDRVTTFSGVFLYD